MTTTNMGLDLPVPSSTIGPEWAQKLITALQTVDAHDHTLSNGVVLAGGLSASVIGAYPYTILTTDSQKILIVDTTSARALTLPAATTAMYVMVKDGTGSAATNNITVSRAGSDTIDGSSSYAIDANYAAVAFVSDGISKWYVV